MAGAITAAVVGAAGAAYSADQANKRAKKAAKAANAPQTNEPFQGQWLAPMGGRWLESQSTLVDQAMHRNNTRFNGGGSPSDAHGAGGGGGGRRGRRGGGGGGGNGGGGGRGSGSMYGGIYDAAMGQVGGANPAVQAGNDFTQEVLGSDSFAGRNQYNEDLYSRLGNASFDQPIEALSAFLAGGQNYGGGKGGGRGGGGFRMSAGASGGGAPAHPTSPGGVIPDTMDQDSWFNDRVKEIWDPSQMDPANNPTLKPYIDALTADSDHAFRKQLGDLKAGLEGAGRMGTGFSIATRNNAAENATRALNAELAGVYMNDYNNAWDRRMSSMGEVSARDKAAMADLTDRYGIDQNAAASRAASAASAQSAMQAAQLQYQLGMRGQDLGALEMMMGHQQFGLGQLQGLGNQLTAEQQSTLGNIDDLTGAGLSPLQYALGAAGGQANAEASARAAANARAAQGLANRRFDFERGVYEDQFAQNTLDHAFANMARFGGMGGTSTGPQVTPNLTDPFGAAVMGGVGAYSAVRGAQG